MTVGSSSGSPTHRSRKPPRADLCKHSTRGYLWMSSFLCSFPFSWSSVAISLTTFCSKFIALTLHTIPADTAFPSMRTLEAQALLPETYTSNSNKERKLRKPSASRELSVDGSETSRGSACCGFRADGVLLLLSSFSFDVVSTLVTSSSHETQYTPRGLDRILSQTKPASRDDGQLTHTFDEASKTGHTVYTIGRRKCGYQGLAGFRAVLPNVAAVEVLGNDGSGQIFEIAYGPDFIAIDSKRTGTFTTAPLSLGGGVSNTVDSAVNPMANIGRRPH
ncbi:hypothetical protein BJ322DRAFT_1102557 [Thelephora terrestris]|uniref:Uncharacterized protein n=1 Tax=Thelephora terrestris TaxID=56493 RepID=A0A9P6HQI5_9AGAM|nr:hypothetical protein BJ322DRAFT_1102557 [Thelephora terrestris]